MTFPATKEPTRTKTTPNNSSKARPASKQRTGVKPKAEAPATGTKASVRLRPKAVSPRRGSKTAKVLAMLRRPEGASLKQLLKATGWQPHSIRGFLSGTVARKMGLKISSIKAKSGERRYAVLA